MTNSPIRNNKQNDRFAEDTPLKRNWMQYKFRVLWPLAIFLGPALGGILFMIFEAISLPGQIFNSNFLLSVAVVMLFAYIFGLPAAIFLSLGIGVERYFLRANYSLTLFILAAVLTLIPYWLIWIYNSTAAVNSPIPSFDGAVGVFIAIGIPSLFATTVIFLTCQYYNPVYK